MFYYFEQGVYMQHTIKTLQRATRAGLNAVPMFTAICVVTQKYVCKGSHKYVYTHGCFNCARIEPVFNLAIARYHAKCQPRCILNLFTALWRIVFAVPDYRGKSMSFNSKERCCEIYRNGKDSVLFIIIYLLIFYFRYPWE